MDFKDTRPSDLAWGGETAGQVPESLMNGQDLFP